MSRVAVSGATGRIGRTVVEMLRLQDRSVQGISRTAKPGFMTWDDLDLSGFDAVIHLAGEPLAQRWTDAAKERIRSSRVETTRKLVEALRTADPRPSVLVSQSADGAYRKGFIGEVVAAWEAEARKAEELGVRVAITRTGVVITKDHGALEKMLLPFKLGVGGPVAGGDQPFPWIHLSDAASAILFALSSKSVSGPIDVVAPGLVDNKEFTKALGRALHRPTFMPVPRFAMKLLYGEMEQMVTEGVKIEPTELQQLGFRFQYPTIDEALKAELG